MEENYCKKLIGKGVPRLVTGCKITIEETITDISELKNLKGNVSHLVKMSDDWRILKNDN